MSDFASCVARTLTGAYSMFFDVLFILHPSSVQTPNASSGGIGKTVRPCSLNLRRSGGGDRRCCTQNNKSTALLRGLSSRLVRGVVELGCMPKQNRSIGV